MEKQIHTGYDLVKVAVFTKTYKAVLKLKENPEDLEAKAVYNALINVMENAALLDEFNEDIKTMR